MNHSLGISMAPLFLQMLLVLFTKQMLLVADMVC